MTTQSPAAADLPVDTHFSIYDQEMADNRDAVFDELRARCPVAHSDQTEDEGFWVVTSYDDVVAGGLDPGHYSSRFVTLPRDQFGSDYQDRPPLTLDPPVHTKFRRRLQPHFTPNEMQVWIPTIREIAREQIAKFIDRGSCEAKAEYTRRISAGMMRSVFGIPKEVEADFERWLHGIVESGDMELAAESSRQLYAYLDGHVEERRREPQDDLITKIMESEVDGRKLEQDELLGTLVVLLLAALETVASTLANILVHLATNPEDRARLIAEPDLIPTAVEEFLRYYAHVTSARESTEDTVLGGVEIPRDHMVLLCWGAANRDRSAFERADEVIVDRQRNRHVAFGIGPHRCLGSALARLELRVGIEEWLVAIPEFGLAEGTVPGYTIGLVCGPQEVPLTFPLRGAVEAAE